MSFKEIMQKAINAKTKAGLKSNIIVQNFNIYYSKSYCPFNNIILRVQTQKTTIKGFYPKEVKAKDLKLALPCTNVAETSKQSRKNMKKKIRKHKQDIIRE